jgi:IPT/TIG domain/PKD-like domain
MKRILQILLLGLMVIAPVTSHAATKQKSETKEKKNLVPAPAEPEFGESERQKEQEREREKENKARAESKALPHTDSIPTIQALGEEDESDADLPQHLRGRIDKAEYMRLRDEYFGTLRGLSPDGTFDIGKRNDAVKKMERQIALRPKPGPNVVGDPAWINLGPAPVPNGQTQQFPNVTPVSGRATCVVVDPANSNKVYLGTAQGGVWRSLDGGATWTPIFDAAQSLAIGALALAPSNTSILYVGTGEPNNSADSFFGVGVYRIDNVDTTPVLVGPINPPSTTGSGAGQITTTCFTGRAISKILVHPSDPATIFVSTAAGVGGAAGNALTNLVPPLGLRGVFRSTNATAAAGAVTFQKLIVNTDGSLDSGPATGNTSIFDMVMEPGNPDNILVSTSGTTTGGAIYRSTNANAATPTFTQTLFPGFNGLVMKLAINKVGAVVTAYVGSNEPSSVPSGCGAQSGRVRKSVDGGVTWSVPLVAAEGYCGGQCSYDNPVGVDPTDANIVYIAGNARGTCSDVLARSNDGGTTFIRDDEGLHADSHGFAFDPLTIPTTVWFVNDGGVWKRPDATAGTPWLNQNTTGLSTLQFVSIAVHPTDEFLTIGGTQDNGTEAMTGSNGNWVSAESGDGGFALIDQSSTDTTNVTMYHTFFNQQNNFIGFDRTNLGTCLPPPDADKDSWEFRGGGFANDPSLSCDGTAFTLTNGILSTDATLFYAPMALGPGGAGNPNTLYFGTSKLYRSTDRGDTMTLVSQNPILAPGTSATGTVVSAIGISPTNDNVRIVGLRNGAVFTTTTGSAVLTNTSFPTPTNANASAVNRHIGRAVVDPLNPNTAYVTLSYYTNPATAGQIWRTTNLNGAPPTWTSIGNSATGLPNVPVNGFAIDANDPNFPGVSILYAGTDIGVYRSTDSGASWTPFGNPVLPRVSVFDMAIQASNRILRVATHGRGAWQITLPPCNLPVATITPTPAQVCANSTGNTAAGPAGMTTYAWSIVNGTITSATNIQNITYDAGASGTVDLTLTVTTCGPSAPTTVNVPINANPTATITPTPAQVCANSTGNTADGPAGASTYAWSIVNGTITSATNIQTITYDAGASGTVDLTLTVTNAAGCSATNTVNVTINANPSTPTITPTPAQVCANSTGNTADGPAGATTYAWSIVNGTITSAANIQTITYDAGASGTVDLTLVVTNAAGCSATNTVNVTINANPSTPTITPTPSPVCGNSTGNTADGPAGATTYAWSIVNGTITSATNIQTITYTAGASGTVDLTLVVTNAAGCSATNTVNVTINANPTPTITPTPAQVCANSTGNTADGPAGATTYAWSIVNGTITSATNIQTITYTAGASGTVDLTLTVTNAAGCSASNTVNVTINANPSTPTITPTPAQVCANSAGNSAAGPAGATTYAWSIVNGTITSATNGQNITYTAGASGTVDLTLVVTNASGCSATNTVNVTINANPSAPTITPTPPQVCANSVGNTAAGPAGATTYAWSIVNGTITSATNGQNITYTAGASGTVDLTLVVTNASGCSATNTVNVTINPNPDATITAPASVVTGSTGNAASVADAGIGATYTWGIVNGTITGGVGTANITFTAGAVGPLTLNVTVTTGAGCSDSDSVNVTVTAAPPPVTVTNVSPNSGTYLGGTNVTITGTGFLSGASVTFGGSAATSVVVVNSTTITAVTPAHALGAVNVTVTNTDTTTGTLTNGYTYIKQFDPNNDGIIDPSDIFYLVNYLFSGGPAPIGPGGLLSGDANNDHVVDPADIFYVVNYLFLSGPAPSVTGSHVSTEAAGQLRGSVTLGTPVVREGRTFIPVIVGTAADSMQPQALSLKLRMTGEASVVAVRRVGVAQGLQPAFEVTRAMADGAAYLVAFDGRASGLAAAGQSAVVAEIEVEHGAAQVRIDVDPALTMLSRGGVNQATVAMRTLQVRGVTIAPSFERRPDARERN